MLLLPLLLPLKPLIPVVGWLLTDVAFHWDCLSYLNCILLFLVNHHWQLLFCLELLQALSPKSRRETLLNVVKNNRTVYLYTGISVSVRWRLLLCLCVGHRIVGFLVVNPGSARVLPSLGVLVQELVFEPMVFSDLCSYIDVCMLNIVATVPERRFHVVERKIISS